MKILSELSTDSDVVKVTFSTIDNATFEPKAETVEMTKDEYIKLVSG